MTKQIEQYADLLFNAELNGSGISPLTELNPDLTPVDAYHIQLHNINKKLAQGQVIVGKKIGLTSLAMQELLGVDEPDYGHLLSSMVVENGGTIGMNDVLQPRVEGEIAFILKDELKGPNVTVLDVLKATKYVVPALEIVGSRVKDWKIKLPDTIADNASCGLYVLGNKLTPVEDVDLETVGMVLTKNGYVANTGAGAAVLGNPAFCVAWLANKLSQFDISLRPGEVILSGALSAMVAAEPGDTFTAKFSQLGQVTVNFVE